VGSKLQLSFVERLPKRVRLESVRFQTHGFDALQEFQQADYNTMNADHARNRAFTLGLRAAHATHAQHSIKSVLEIGPGSELVLTKLVTQACPQVDQVVAFECNAKAITKLSVTRHVRQAKFTLVPKLVSDPSSMQILRQIQPDLVLHEIVGCLASLELAHVTLTHLFQALEPNMKRLSAPGVFGTFFLPTNLSLLNPQTSRVAIAEDESQLVLLASFVAHCALDLGLGLVGTPAQAKFGTVEIFDCLAAAKGQLPPEVFMRDQCYWNTFVAKQDALCDVLLLFVALGFDDNNKKTKNCCKVQGLFDDVSLSSLTTSLDLHLENPNVLHARNWPVPVVILARPLQLKAGDYVKVATRTHLTQIQPEYEFVLTHLRDGVELSSERFVLNKRH
jgi:hypothetical protein